jgi:hypothetical protein
VEQLPRAIQMTFGGGPYKKARCLKSESFETTINAFEAA